MTVDVQVRHCALTIHRRDGWSWGPDARPHVDAALAALEAALQALVLEAGIDPSLDAVIEEPVRLEIDAGGTLTGTSLAALAEQLQTLDSPQRALTPLSLDPGGGQTPLKVVEGSWGQGARDVQALARTLGRWSRGGQMLRIAQGWPDAVVWSWVDAVEQAAARDGGVLAPMQPEAVVAIAGAVLDGAVADRPPAERLLILVAAVTAALGDVLPDAETQAVARREAGVSANPRGAVGPEVSVRAGSGEVPEDGAAQRWARSERGGDERAEHRDDGGRGTDKGDGRDDRGADDLADAGKGADAEHRFDGADLTERGDRGVDGDAGGFGELAADYAHRLDGADSADGDQAGGSERGERDDRGVDHDRADSETGRVLADADNGGGDVALRADGADRGAAADDAEGANGTDRDARSAGHDRADREIGGGLTDAARWAERDDEDDAAERADAADGSEHGARVDAPTHGDGSDRHVDGSGHATRSDFAQAARGFAPADRSASLRRPGAADIVPALPLLVLAELALIGQVDAMAAAAAVVQRDGVPVAAGLASALAGKVLLPPAFGWMREPVEVRAIALAGGDVDGLEAVVQAAELLLPPLASALRAAYAEGRSANDEVLVTETAADGIVVGEEEGLLPIAWVAGADELEAALAVLGNPPVQRNAAFAPVMKALAARPALPRVQALALERQLGVMAGTALGLIALDLWGPTSPLLALERLGDLEARVEYAADALVVSIPRGQRWLDLRRGGLLDAFDVPWLPGGRLEIGTW